jgi:8-oxo-dGTP pyrophosphatase MutT (NUDIX family)
MRLLIDLAYRLRRRMLALLRWQTRGVKVMVFDPAGRLLLVRHRYGRSDLWMLPGGGIARGEAPEAAAVREIAEETGCVLAEVRAIGRYVAMAEGRCDHVHLFEGRTADEPEVDGVELAEARFFALGALPPTLSAATRRRMDEFAGLRASDGLW